jgi:hypothetical protein
VAQANVVPTQDLQAGAAAFDEDLPRVLELLGASSLEAMGWSRPNRLSLLVPAAGRWQGREDRYLLRLGFQAYREWPPSAQFVNPETGGYVYPKDQCCVPMLTSPECRTHVAYRRYPQASPIQLICCSATLEFYEVLHPVTPEHLWRETDTFLTTIMAIRRAMTSFYGGRNSADGQ